MPEELSTYKMVADVIVSPIDTIVLGFEDETSYLHSIAPENEIATVGDIDTQGVPAGGATGQVLAKVDGDDYNTEWVTPAIVSDGEAVRYTPAFTATGLTYTGTGASHPCYNSYYTKVGSMVSFYIEINPTTVTNFGTGQYFLELPFMPHGTMMNHFTGWVNVDPTQNPDNAGHVILNIDHLVGTKTLDMHYIKQAGGAHTPIMEAIFKQGTPVTLTTSSRIYVNGTYITSE